MFDFSLSLLSLHLIPNFETSISNILNLLHPGGKFFFNFFGDEEFNKELLQNDIPKMIECLNPKIKKETTSIKFPSIVQVKKSMIDKRVNHYYIYQYKKKFF